MKTGILFALMLAACGQDKSEPLRAPDLVVDGVGVLNDSTVSYAGAADFSLRFHNVLAATAEYAGRDLESFEGLTVILLDGPIQCESETGTCSGTLTGSVIRINTARHDECIENSVLAHELLHVLIGDECHTNSLWHTRLSGGEGFRLYADILNADPATTCNVFASYQTVYPSC